PWRPGTVRLHGPFRRQPTEETAMRLIALAATVSAISFAAACGANGEAPSPQQATGAPLETRPANNPDQRPAFANQTRAPSVRTERAMTHAVVASGLSHPWGLALLPDGDWLVTERPGRMRVISSEGAIGDPIAGLPEVDARGQGGLLDVIVGPSFESDR